MNRQKLAASLVLPADQRLVHVQFLRDSGYAGRERGKTRERCRRRVAGIAGPPCYKRTVRTAYCLLRACRLSTVLSTRPPLRSPPAATL